MRDFISKQNAYLRQSLLQIRDQLLNRLSKKLDEDIKNIRELTILKNPVPLIINLY